MLQLGSFVCECVGGGWGLGEAEGWMPLLTRPQQYCDPASLVYFIFPPQVRLRVEAEAVDPPAEVEKRPSRNRSTQVPTPTEDDCFFPGEYLKEKEKEKLAKSVWG